MDELIDRIVGAVGIDRETARQAVSIILSFLRTEGPTDKVDELLAKIGTGPGEVDADAGEDRSGGLGGLMGGGAMAVAARLQGIGLGMGEIQGVTRETVDYAREKGGDDLVNEIVAAIPGLGQFV